MAINKPRTDKHCLYEYTLDQEAQIAAAKSLPFKAENVKVYNFAEEHKSLESFTEDFKIMSREVLKLEPGDTALVPCDVHLRICRNCRQADPGFACVYKEGFEKEYCFSGECKPRQLGQEIYCPNCGAKNIGKVVCYDMELRDIRFNDKPSVLCFERKRLRCPICRRLCGDERIQGLQSFVRSGMSLRLFASVLACIVSGVARRYIVEAYAITDDSVDRAKYALKKLQILKQDEADYNYIVEKAGKICYLMSTVNTPSETNYKAFFFAARDNSLRLAAVTADSELQKIKRSLKNMDINALTAEENPKVFLTNCAHLASGLLKVPPSLMPFYLIGYTLLRNYLELLRHTDYEWSEMRDNMESTYRKLSKALSKDDVRTVLEILQELFEQIEKNHYSEELLGSLIQRRGVILEDLSFYNHTIAGEDAPWEKDVYPKRSSAQRSFVRFLSGEIKKTRLSDDEIVERLMYLNPAVLDKQNYMRLTDERFAEEYEEYLKLEDGQSGTYLMPEESSDESGVAIYCLKHLIVCGLLREDNSVPLDCRYFSRGSQPCYNKLNCPYYTREENIEE